MKSKYIEMMIRLETKQRGSLEVLKHELDNLSIYDINPVQTNILYCVGNMKRVAISDLVSKGYYPGSNISYNIKKVTDNGYIAHQKSDHDKRSTVLTLTPKGEQLFKRMQAFFDKHIEILQANGLTEEELDIVSQVFNKLEISWNSILLSRR